MENSAGGAGAGEKTPLLPTEPVKTSLLLKSVRYGPILLLHYWSSYATFVAMQPLLLQITCEQSLALPPDLCSVLTNGNATTKVALRAQETELQVEIAGLMFWRSVVTYIFPLFLVLSIGSWSDRHGRRLPVLAYLASMLVQNVILIVCAQLTSSSGIGGGSYLLPWVVAVGSCTLTALIGGEPAFMMTFFGHIADTSTEGERTFVNGCAMSFMFAGLALGYNVGGFLATALSPTLNFLLNLVMEAVALIYASFLLKTDSSKASQEGLRQMVTSFLDFGLIRDSFRTTFKRRPGHTHLAIALLILAHICGQAPWMGELSVVYLFGKYKFSWSTAEYGAFTSTRYVAGFLGNWLTGTLLAKMLHLSDPWIGIWTCTTSFGAYLLFIWAPSIPWMYVGSLLTLGISTMQIIPRSIMTKLVSSDEIGAVTSFLAIFDCLIGISAAPFYAEVYAFTLGSFTSAFFVISATLMAPGIGVYIFLLIIRK